MKIKNRFTKFPQHGLKFPSISQTNNLRTCTSSETNNENRVAFMYMHFKREQISLTTPSSHQQKFFFSQTINSNGIHPKNLTEE